MSMKISGNPASRVCRGALAVVLAAGITWPCGMALATDDAGDAAAGGSQQEIDQQPGGQTTEPAPTGGGEEAEEPAPAAEEPAPDAPAAEESESSDSKPAAPAHEGRDNEQVLKAAREASLQGLDALEKWLAGSTLTDEELVSIDLVGLAAIDAELAAEIEPAQTAAKERLAEAEESQDGDADGTDKASEKGKGDKKKAADSPKSKYPAWKYAGDTSMPPTFHGPSLRTAKFVAVFGESARKLAADNDLYASVMIAQAILASESGDSALAQAPNYNLFALEGNYHGDCVSVGGKTGDDAAHAAEATDYKRYPSYEIALEDYVDLLSGEEYGPAHKSAAKSYAEACEFLEGTYEDEESYAESLQELIEAYDLERYDEPLGYELADGGEANLADLAILAADKLGRPYVWGGVGPAGYDCSGLVMTTYGSALGVQLPRTTYYQCQLGEDVDFADLHMGDLLFFTNGKNEACHVAMYVGEGCYIESTTPGGVQVTAMSERMPVFAKRMIATREV